MAVPMLTTDTARDNPEAYIPRDRRRALAEGRELPDRVTGSALFADISGFTPLTEALAAELGSQRGPEELTRHIGRVFHAVIDELDQRGGDVIYFSGDAITCWIDGDDGVRAVAAALGMQAAMESVGRIETPAGRVVELGLKVAVAVGNARRFVVGDPDLQLMDVLAGSLIDDLAEAEHHAERGQIVLDRSAVAALGDRVRLTALPHPGGGHARVALLEGLLVPVAGTPVVEPPELPDELVRPWLLPEVYERILTGRGEFLAELRPAYPVFLRFGGIDYDDDDEATARLDDFVSNAQRIFARFGGNVLQLTLGDKGAYLYGVFGSPIAHEDDAARAAAAALELRELDRSTAARDIQVGIAHGRLRSGTYGHAMRRTFVCLGDAVNLAARLMSAAPTRSIYVSHAVRMAAGDTFLWESLPPLVLKGKARPVGAHALAGSLERASRRRLRFELPLAGRIEELALLEGALSGSLAGTSRIVGISAEAGMGKSRLVAEFVRDVRRRGVSVAFAECQSFGATTGYFVWREIWHRLLGGDDDTGPIRLIAQVEARLASVDAELVPRLPLLGPVLGIDIPDTELTTTFDAKLRKSSLEDLLARCLRSIATERPLVVVLEDCHWIDELSRDLLQVLARAATTLPVLFVLAYRPADAPGGGLGVEALPGYAEIRLDELDQDEAAKVVRAKLGQLLGADATVPEWLADLVTARAEGNPLYIEELVSYVVGQETDLADPSAAATVQLPESLHSLVLSRIDTLSEAPRRTLKVASVIGRVFRASVLPEVYPELGRIDDVRGHLTALRTVDLVRLDREAEEAYLFKHVVTQEVAYESMPFAVRASLHTLVGSYIERVEADTIDQQLDLLAHHFWRSGDDERKRHYLGRAADAARAAYGNAAAIDYLERLLPLLDGRDRIERTLGLVEVLHVAGDVPRAEALARDAGAAAEALGDRGLAARSSHLVGESLRRLGRFDDAGERLRFAHDEFAAIGDEARRADALQVTGTVNAMRGDIEVARAKYEESLAIRERLGDEAGVAALSNNLGIVLQQEGDTAAARASTERALELYAKIGDRRRIGMCHANLAWIDGMRGDHESEREHCEVAIRYAREVGDALNLAIAQNNYGDALRDLGRLDEAGEAYATAVESYRDLGDRGPLMALLEDVAVLASRRGDHATAFTLAGVADALRSALGSSRTSTDEGALASKLAGSRASLGDAGAAARRAAGAALPLDEAIARTIAAARGSAPVQ
jgi:class 3 adenylate cyclase/tetratricopeptide (TPR) repeat protein